MYFYFFANFLLVPAQPSGFEAEAELDTRIMLKWLWPVQEPITLYELHYWESGSDNKVRNTLPDFVGHHSVIVLCAGRQYSVGFRATPDNQR